MWSLRAVFGLQVHTTRRMKEREKHECVTKKHPNWTWNGCIRSLGIEFIKAINTFWDFVVTLAHFRNFKLIFGENEKEGLFVCDQRSMHPQQIKTLTRMHFKCVCVRVSFLSILMRAWVLLHASSFMCPLLLLLLLLLVFSSCSQNGKSIYRQCYMSFERVCRNNNNNNNQWPTKSLCRFLLSLFFC